MEILTGVLITLAVEFVVLFVYSLCRAAGKESRHEEEMWEDRKQQEESKNDTSGDA